jgi:adsorption protein B
MTELPELLDAAARAVAWPVSLGILLNQIDELAVDLTWLARPLLGSGRPARPLARPAGAPAPRIAVMVPAWRESEVIAAMLERNLGSIDYPSDRVEFYCGTYRNDPETQACVARVAGRDPRVHKVVVEHDGPTSKADCLNAVWRGLRAEERRRAIRYDILVMHDAEDVVHPEAFRLYARLLPAYEFVQTPVFSLVRRAGGWVAGTYLDEFAEHHLKELPVRAAIGGLVPSAGVGSAFDRAAFEEVALAGGRDPFDAESLTEDYEIGLRFRLAGRRVHFACQATAGDGHPGRLAPRDWIATREYFPSRFSASVRQRSRWITGIALQSARRIGWRGDAAVRWCLWRDRKSILTNTLLVFAYLLFLYALGRGALAAATGTPWSLSSIIPDDGLLAAIVAANTVALAWRGAVKAWFVGRLYGPAQAALSLPRMVVGNVIALAATARALRAWLGHRLGGVPLVWAKTAHEFPLPVADPPRVAKPG